jgi:hypothetical protein
VIDPSRPVIFHQVLVATRETSLMDAVSEALGEIDPSMLKKQIPRLSRANIPTSSAGSGSV